MTHRSHVNCSVIIASSRASVRARWKKAIHDVCTITPVSEMADLRRKVLNIKPSVLFIDIDLPRLEQIKGIVAIQRLTPATKIVVITSSPDPHEELMVLE